MRRLAMLASLLLAVPVPASGQPPTAEDRAYPRGDWEPIASGRLGAPVTKLIVGAQAGRYNRLRLSATRGHPWIRTISVRFVDDTLHTIDLHRTLRVGESIDLDLPGHDRAISSITVSGEPDDRAWYAISALR